MSTETNQLITGWNKYIKKQSVHLAALIKPQIKKSFFFFIQIWKKPNNTYLGTNSYHMNKSFFFHEPELF